MRKLIWMCLLAGCATEEVSTTSDEIIGGTTDNGDPAVVAVFAHAPGATSGSLCTGTVIAPTKVLTAAHCVDPAVVGTGMVFDVLTGTTINLSNNLGPVASTAFDPAWDPNNLTAGHDVGMVTLQNPTTITPIPWNNGTYSSALAASPVRIVGYGTNNHFGAGAGTKRTVTTTIADWDDLVLHIGTNSKSNCHGDSGGPAFQMINGVETVVGVTSYGTDLLSLYQCIGGGYDTRVDVYKSFISSH
jgi:secreted trypsin-like serine protease